MLLYVIAIASVEYQWWKKTGKLLDLSEQQLVDCAYVGHNGCQGGWQPDAFDYVKKAGGVSKETAYPYKAVYGNCTVKPYVSKLNATKAYVQVPGDDLSIKAALKAYGSLTAVVAVYQWSSYKTGVFSDPIFSTTKVGVNHAINIVGYGTTVDSSNKTIPYWIGRY